MRIQILPLPSVVKGDDVEEPFALIVDQHDADMDEQTAEQWHQFKTSAGARALLIVSGTVEVVDRYAAPTPVTANVSDMVVKDADVEKIAEQASREIQRLRDNGLWHV